MPLKGWGPKGPFKGWGPKGLLKGWGPKGHFKGYWSFSQNELPPQIKRESGGSLKK